MLWAEWLTTEVLAPVGHHPWVFTVPERLRVLFLYDRRLLGELSRCAWQTARDLYRAGLEDRHAVAGMVMSIQTYGDLANWQSHLHALVSVTVAVCPRWDETCAGRPGLRPLGVATAGAAAG